MVEGGHIFFLSVNILCQVVVGCAADLPSGVLQFSTNGVWATPTFTGVRCVGDLETLCHKARVRPRCTLQSLAR